MIVGNNMKKFEKPTSGLYQAVLADIVDVGPVENKKFNKINNMVRFVWLLIDKDKEGNNFRVMRQVNATLTVKPKKSNLYTIVADMLGKNVEIPYELENLIGRNNLLLVKRKEEGEEVYANVESILELKAGTPLFTVPATFERDHVRKARLKAEADTKGGVAQAPAVAAPTAQAQQAQASVATTVADEDIPF